MPLNKETKPNQTKAQLIELVDRSEITKNIYIYIYIFFFLPPAIGK